MPRINGLYGSQTSPVALCMQNSVISARITSLHGSHTSTVVLCLQNSVISTRITSLYWSQTSPVVLCMQNRCLAPELLVSMGPRPHLWLLQENQRLLDQNYRSLGSQTSPVNLWMENSVLRSRMTLVYCYQPSSVVLCIHNSDIMTRIKSLCGFQTSPMFFLHSKQRL